MASSNKGEQVCKRVARRQPFTSECGLCMWPLRVAPHTAAPGSCLCGLGLGASSTRRGCLVPPILAPALRLGVAHEQ